MQHPTYTQHLRAALHLIPCLTLLLAGCVDMGSTASGSARDGNGNGGDAQTTLIAGYKQAKWGSNMSATFPDDCTMTIVSNGLPNHRLPAWYLTPPNSNSSKTVVKTPDGLGLVVDANPNSLSPITMSFNICPTKTAKITQTNMGMTGVMISGAALFNAFDADKNPALQQNLSYAFTDSNGNKQTASFIDDCSGHYTPSQLFRQGRYHYHGVSSCVTAQTDSPNGASHLIGVALDGFPVYGGRDMQGRVITLSELDTCNGITSPTPEFPQGVYHYVLPEGVTGAQSAPQCYHGNISQRQMWRADADGTCSTTQGQTAMRNLPSNAPARQRALAPATQLSTLERSRVALVNPSLTLLLPLL